MRQMILVHLCDAMTIKQSSHQFSKKMNEYAYIAGILFCPKSKLIKDKIPVLGLDIVERQV